ncbi:CHAT domain-containing protein [Streptomyces lunaelactis]|uniref:CHAT domain-containing protein n=1 Tax=Streptomyces lunaelactis TaxID=1535768 RepID=UPI001584761A|nr:CHAT domain-containing protein [Streptomyces lunaelactis]NUK01106.1 CHAT domain-containing protein [Streptomyces lunaelactis]NUK16850.1 CHAT domain-containing protein [Streptomyces lunaelactis]
MQEDPAAAVAARVRRFETEDDLSAVLEPEALADARRLTGALRDSDVGETRTMLGSLYWYRSWALQHEGRSNDEETEAAVQVLAPCFVAGGIPLPPLLLPLLAQATVPVALAMLQQMREEAGPDLCAAVPGLWGRIVEATPPIVGESRAFYLAKLSEAVLLRFKKNGAQPDLEAAITIAREAVQRISSDHPNRAGYLHTLGEALQARHKDTGDRKPLAEAIAVFRQAVRIAHPDDPARAMYRAHLADTLLAQFRSTETTEHLNDAIEAHGLAVHPAHADNGDEAQGRLLCNLSILLRERFERTGEPGYLHEAITIGRRALEAAPKGDPTRASVLSNLGAALRNRFGATGKQDFLNEAVSLLREAERLTPREDPGRAANLSNLGAALGDRFVRTGAQDDLHEAIEHLREAVQTALPQPSAGSESGVFWANLSGFLRRRFERFGEPADLDESIDAAREGVNNTPVDHKNRALHLSTLAAALGYPATPTGRPSHLDETVDICRLALRAAPPGHPLHTLCLSNLSDSLRLQHQSTGGESGNLDEAVETARAAVQAASETDPHRVVYQYNLGRALHARAQETTDGEDVDAATKAYADASQNAVGTPAWRISAAAFAAELAQNRGNTRYAAEILENAVHLLPDTVPRQLARADQQHALGNLTGLASDAAAFALAAHGQAGAARALGLLEQGRAVLLSQALDTRSDLTDLQQQHPELAARYIRLRDQLHASSASSPSNNTGPTAAAPAYEIHDRHQISAQFTAAIAEIRRLDDFHAFHLPPDTEQLRKEAYRGPVVVYNVSHHRSDAILVQTEGITNIELPGLTVETAGEKLFQFHASLAAVRDPRVGEDELDRAQHLLHDVLEWLWEAAAEPVLEKLKFRDASSEGAPLPRIWWVPGGPFGLLPIHAAGRHRQKTGHTVMDRVVSSYAPTIRSLGHARQGALPPAPPGKALIVAMPTTPGAPPLPYVRSEVENLKKRLPQHIVLTESPGTGGDHAPDAIPTAANVFSRLADCSIAHFACHAVSDAVDPSRSGLLLHDHQTTPMTIASLASVNLDQARLAYLSACRTALTADLRLVDEAIHLTSAFQLAGFRHVIGTLWEVNDRLAARVSDSFYSSLLSATGRIEDDRVATALHNTMRAQRNKYLETPSLWAAHIHVGP